MRGRITALMTQKWLSYPLTFLFFVLSGLILVIFQPIQWLFLKIGGYEGHKRLVSFISWLLIKCTHILGTRYTFDNPYDLPTDRPLLLVANHQSLYDIPFILWHLRKHHPKFVSKIELAHGIPSVSFSLRHGGSVLINRKDPRQAMTALKKLGAYSEQHKRSAVIFPEGTRSHDGVPRKFRTMGLKVLMKHMPSALIVPMTINGSWKLFRFGKFPMGLGGHFIVKIHQPLENKGDLDAMIANIEKQIIQSVYVPVDKALEHI